LIKVSICYRQKGIRNRKEIVDVITFCNHEDYLDLPKANLNLWISQRVILKCFYKNTIGNEDLVLNQEEWQWLYDNESDEELEGYTYERNIKDVIKKMLDMEKFHKAKASGNNPNKGKKLEEQKAEYFSMLHLVLGRRGSKTLMASIITAYEAYKLLVINNGDPHEYYNLPYDDEIAIINVALEILHFLRVELQNQLFQKFDYIQIQILEKNNKVLILSLMVLF
jgi:hypothetical protein